MSVWVEPKTNWNGNEDEYFNIVPDYQRIKGNIEFLGEYANIFGFDRNNLYTMENVTLQTRPTPSFANNIVYNFDVLKNFFGDYITGYRNMKTYVEKGNIWNYNDLNIIEKNTLVIKQKLDSMYLTKEKLPFIQLGIANLL